MSTVASCLHIRNTRTGRLGAGAAALLSLLALAGCERPFVAERTPQIEVLPEELRGVVTESTAQLRVRATSFRPISRVELDGRPLTFSEQGEVWTATLNLAPGLNTHVLTAYDVEGLRGVDTLRTLYLPLRTTGGAPSLPAARGGHAATLLADGSLLVTGGTAGRQSPATSDAFLLSPGASAFQSASSLNGARTGHTATLLPDGRVLILGGAAVEEAGSAAQFVQQPEIYDPATGAFSTVIVSGDPIRRMYHATVAYEKEGRTFVALLGGVSVFGSNTTPFPTGRLNRYELQGERLVPVGRAQGATCIYSASYLRLTRLTGSEGRYLYTGSLAGSGRDDTHASIVDLSSDATECGAFEDLREIPQPRLYGADVELLPGTVALLGGLSASDESRAADDEVFVYGSRRFLTLPSGLGIQKRYGHTATKLPSQRILLLGGFDPSGAARSDAQYLTVETE